MPCCSAHRALATRPNSGTHTRSVASLSVAPASLRDRRPASGFEGFAGSRASTRCLHVCECGRDSTPLLRTHHGVYFQPSAGQLTACQWPHAGASPALRAPASAGCPSVARNHCLWPKLAMLGPPKVFQMLVCCPLRSLLFAGTRVPRGPNVAPRLTMQKRT